MSSYGAHNISALRRFIMNVYKADTSKRRLKSKIMQSRYYHAYRERLLFNEHMFCLDLQTDFRRY